MTGAVKHSLKSVSWAPGLKLCQVRLFLSEDAPVMSGFEMQDQLQAKASRLLHLRGGENDESLPPGFETPYHMNIKQLKYETSQIKPTKWKCPIKFSLSAEWLVVSGEESEEVEAENKRQRGTLEAIYPRASSIPPNPSVSPEVERAIFDDSRTPLVPIIAIEEGEIEQPCEVAAFSEHSTPQQLPNSSVCLNPSVSLGLQHHQGNAMLSTPPNPPLIGLAAVPTIPGVEPDVAAAASAVFTAMMKSSDKGSLIDHELLINILRDPKTVEKLLLENGVQSQVTAPSMPTRTTVSLPSQVLSSSTITVPTVSVQSQGPISAPSASMLNDSAYSSSLNSRLYSPSSMFPSQHGMNLPSLSFVPQSNSMPINKSTVQSQGEDLAHFKNLVHQHGREYDLPENWDNCLPQHVISGPKNSVDRGEFQHQSLEQERDAKIKRRILKSAGHCIYYNSPKGCRKGSNCSYIHDSSLPQRVGDLRNTKRVKLDRE